MRKYVFWVSVLLVMVLPGFLCFVFTLDSANGEVQTPTQTETVCLSNVPCINIIVQGESVQMEFEQYILGVLLGEMPADFNMEALKAQAVASRTYTLKRVLEADKHENGGLCVDAGCCQAFIDPATYGITGSNDSLKRMKQAVRETASQILTYEGSPIEATYFSSSGGRTEAAVAVWGSDIPYLQSVSSPGEKNTGSNENTYQFTKEQFCTLLGLEPGSEPQIDRSKVTYTVGGGVETLQIGTAVFTGTQIRRLLSLPSTAFSLKVCENEIWLTTKGHGHRVGMSQYGAEAMAISGKTYDEILAHYYPGTVLTTFTPDELQCIFDKAGNI